jgi:LDH2 family malate/lactate/ureidoglycolate dehydrogenase
VAGVQTILARVKGAKKLPGVTNIALPGERSDAVAAQNVARGHVTLEQNLYESLVREAQASSS